MRQIIRKKKQKKTKTKKQNFFFFFFLGDFNCPRPSVYFIFKSKKRCAQSLSLFIYYTAIRWYRESACGCETIWFLARDKLIICSCPPSPPPIRHQHNNIPDLSSAWPFSLSPSCSPRDAIFLFCVVLSSSPISRLVVALRQLLKILNVHITRHTLNTFGGFFVFCFFFYRQVGGEEPPIKS